MLWIALLLILGLLAWGAWPRPVGGASGSGADQSRLAVPGAVPATIRVATFNIHGGRGRDGRRDLERQARDLAGIDVAALQEVHDSWRAPRQLDGLAARLGLAVLDAPVRRRWFRRHRSNALLTRWPIGEWTRTPLAGHARQRFHFRNLTIAELHLHRPVWILFTHLNRKQGRDAQLARVMEEFLRRSPAVLMGDFNMNRDDAAMREYLARDDVVDALGGTLDHDDPRRVDWILCRGLTVTNAGVIDTGASDHPLYWCDVKVDESSP